MPLVDVPAVRHLDLDGEHLLGRHIDLPARGSGADGYALLVRGWVVGRTSRAVAVELVHRGAVVRSTPVENPRPDLAALFAGVEAAAHGGFETTVNLLGTDPEAELLVQAVLQDDRRAPMAVIQVRRPPLWTGHTPTLRPLALTTLGRSGSTWVTHLLNQHPQIVAYRPFQYEPRVTTYWMEILKALSNPESYRRAIRPERSGRLWWLGDEGSPVPRRIPDAPLDRWMSRDAVEALAGFCQRQLEMTYQEIAAEQGKPEPLYFAEKVAPTSYVSSLIWELYPGAREIFLVRDLRDVLVSMLSFSRKNARARFFRGRVESERDYVRELSRDASQLLESWRERADRSYLLRYEDLVLRPEPTLASVLRYLDVPADAGTVARVLQEASGRTSTVQRQHQTSASPAASIGRWRRDLDASWEAACSEAFDDTMLAFGYEPDVLPTGSA